MVSNLIESHPRSSMFTFEFYPSVDDFSIPTEVFVPEMHYPGLNINVSVSADLTWQLDGTVLKIYSSAASSPMVLSSVRIAPP